METESRLKQYREWEHECKNCLSFCGCGLELVASFGMIVGPTIGSKILILLTCLLVP
jgi:hypothetical protein